MLHNKFIIFWLWCSTHSCYYLQASKILFVEEFTELLSMISSEFDCFTIAGDFNIHIDDAETKPQKKW